LLLDVVINFRVTFHHVDKLAEDTSMQVLDKSSVMVVLAEGIAILCHISISALMKARQSQKYDIVI
jgi:hypothetical protein